jgi:hypothetical protein
MRQKIYEFKMRRRELGWRGAMKHYGWRVLAAVFVFYLVRDTILYILLPYLLLNNLLCTG